MSLNVGFVPTQDIPFNNYCNNLMWACYFETAVRRAAPTGKVINSIEKAHVYLLTLGTPPGRAYRASLLTSVTWNGLNGLYVLLKSLIMIINSMNRSCSLEKMVMKPTVTIACSRATFDHTALSGFHLHITLLPKPPKELAFSAPGKKLVGVILPPAGSTLGGPNTRKRQREQAAITETPVPVSNIRDEPVAGPISKKSKPKPAPPAKASSKAKPTAAPSNSKQCARKTFWKSPVPNTVKPKPAAKKPVFYPSSDSEVPESSGEEDGDMLGNSTGKTLDIVYNECNS
ncbi:hypothetical protein EDD18DRAFT_1111539 [Armillaria luteobubalina]|uniref:Uncharacterized protein n=1 Tax=Armillaria luteobubalina TaxID=153913 RepID=A0AA39PJE7_9AGAR|nr:hypothetical protein EDD18DRAFT_1111539 [Armillaria luteobubalina]